MSRTPTAVDTLADSYLDAYAALDPIAATSMGIAGHDHELPDLSPEGLQEVSALRQRTLAELQAVEATDSSDRVTIAQLREELTVAELIRAIGADESALNVIHCPLQEVRSAFDLMPTAKADDWVPIATRLAAVPVAIAGYRESLRHAAQAGVVSPQRQVQAAITQCGRNVGADGFFAALVGSASVELPPAVQADLERGASLASDAYAQLAAFLQDELLPQAGTADACGAQHYALFSRQFLGTRIDLAETYQWGQDELARLQTEIAATTDRIQRGASLAEVMAYLDADPVRMLAGTDALQSWMQHKSDQAVAELGASHFDIPEPIRTLECRIAPTHTGGIYYTGPSEDFSRPGQMWWSVPDGVTEFSTWSQLTTVYHEGVPGHHLQVAQTVYRRDLLNRWRRVGSWSSGHGEGWALYAERLMADLGYLSDPGDLLGMLLAQSMRAARVVLDIGVHCGFEAPDIAGGGAWDYDKAWRFLRANAAMADAFLRFELDRYLGWPGQAPSYKVGERCWLQLRDDAGAAAAAAGEPFDLAAFHRRALDIGGVGLDVLRAAVLGEL